MDIRGTRLSDSQRMDLKSARYFFSEIYCGGYSGEDPPLPIPNREVKLAIADGTAPPGGRVGSCHFLIQSPRHHPMSGAFCINASLLADCCLSPSRSWRLMDVTGILPPPARGRGPANAGRGPVEYAAFATCCLLLDFFADVVMVSFAAVS